MKLLLHGKQGQGLYALIDKKDINKHRWLVDSKGYPYKAKSGVKRIFLHQFIMGKYPKGKTEIDHINGNKLDNRRVNLRFCTSLQNRANRYKYKVNKSGYKGVQWHKQGKKWLARVYRNKKPYYLGLFKTPLEAHRAIQKAKS